LPRKALEEIGDKFLIQHVVERVRQIRGVDDVVLAVPNGEVPSLCYCSHVVGPDVPENDVLSRFAHVAELYPKHTTIMRITGDTPLLQPELGDRLLDLYFSVHDCDYAWINTHSGGWPDGLDIEVFSRRMLYQANQCAIRPDDREHVTSYMRRHGRTVELPLDMAYALWPKCSVDDMEDLQRVRSLYAQSV